MKEIKYMTRAGYDALTVKDPDVFYAIMDNSVAARRVVTLTHAEYAALPVKEPDIYYAVYGG